MRICDSSKIRVIVLMGLAVLLAGCETYQPRALNDATYGEVWQARSDDTQTLNTLINELSTERGDGGIQFEVDDGISCEEAEWVVLTYNPTLRVARGHLGVAGVRVEERGRWEDPNLNFDVLRFVKDVPDRWLSGVSLTFTLPISGRLEAAGKLAEAEYQKELMQVYQQENQIRMALRDVWVKWVMNHKRLAAGEEYLKMLELMERRYNALFKVGEVDLSEVGLIRIDRMNQRLAVNRLRGESEVLELRIKQLMGFVPESGVKLLREMPRGFAEQDEFELYELNPELKVLRAEYEVAEKTLLREVKKQYPDLEIGPSYENEEGQSKIGLTGGIPLPILNANIEGIRTARVEREIARMKYEEKYEEVYSQYRQSMLQLESIREQVRASESELIPIINRQQEQVKTLIEQGEVSLLVMIQSEKQVYQAKVDLVSMYEQLHMIENRLALLRGQGVSEKQQPSKSEVNP